MCIAMIKQKDIMSFHAGDGTHTEEDEKNAADGFA
jgi:hypothetical protein